MPAFSDGRVCVRVCVYSDHVSVCLSPSVRVQDLETIQGVTVTISGGSTVCLPGGPATTSITFTQNFGPLPALIVVESTLTHTTVPVRSTACVCTCANVCEYVHVRGCASLWRCHLAFVTVNVCECVRVSVCVRVRVRCVVVCAFVPACACVSGDPHGDQRRQWWQSGVHDGERGVFQPWPL